MGWRCELQSTTRSGTTRCKGLAGIVLWCSWPVGREPLIRAVLDQLDWAGHTTASYSRHAADAHVGVGRCGHDVWPCGLVLGGPARVLRCRAKRSSRHPDSQLSLTSVSKTLIRSSTSVMTWFPFLQPILGPLLSCSRHRRCSCSSAVVSIFQGVHASDCSTCS